MLIGYVSDEYFVALPDTLLELRSSDGRRITTRSSASGVIAADVSAGEYEVCLAKTGFGSKRVRVTIQGQIPIQFRLLSDTLLGYAWPKWCQAGEPVQARVHSVEAYKLTLWRYGFAKTLVRNLGWFGQHAPWGDRQTLPDRCFVETGVAWDSGFRKHRPVLSALETSGLYFFHAKTASGRFTSFPLVVAPARPIERIAVLASTNTWNAYNPFGGRSNYLLASRLADEPLVYPKIDLPTYHQANEDEWKSASSFAPLSFDRPEPFNSVAEAVQSHDPIEGCHACHLAPAEWRLLAWLEREGFAYDLYADPHLHDGILNLNAYKILILNTHPEYWSLDMYHTVKKWVFERGGRLVYLGGQGIHAAIDYSSDGTSMVCRNAWPVGKESRFQHALESEANLLGVVYTDTGAMTSAPYEVADEKHWFFRGSGLRKGDIFGRKTLHSRCGDGASGYATDKVSPNTPSQARILAKGLNPNDGGAHLVCLETPSGGAVFSAGSITYAGGLLCDPLLSKLTAHVIERFLR